MDAKNLADISEAHNHRLNFSTRILSGGYFHTIYQMNLLETGKYYLAPIMSLCLIIHIGSTS